LILRCDFSFCRFHLDCVAPPRAESLCRRYQHNGITVQSTAFNRVPLTGRAFLCRRPAAWSASSNRDPGSRGGLSSAVHRRDSSGQSALRAQPDLLNWINVMLPVQSSLQKYFRSLLTQITCISLAIPAHTKGRFAIVTNVGLGMRWTRAALLTRALPCGRRSRVVLTPRRWRQVGDDALHHADDGGKQARSPGRARNKPLKPSRAGMPGVPVRPW
jgi:hypothetical protein